MTGACNACRLTYRWSPKEGYFRDALCPRHMQPLRRTRYPHKFPYADTPPAFHLGPIRKPLPGEGAAS